MLNTQSPSEYFRLLLLTVVGQAYSAAGFILDERPLQWANGAFRFIKPADTEQPLAQVISYQVLIYTDTQWTARHPSRFRVTLARTDQPHSPTPSQHPHACYRDLSALVVADFGVAILPSAEHWWPFRTTEELGHALAEAGHLVVGYGMPWLAGQLVP